MINIVSIVLSYIDLTFIYYYIIYKYIFWIQMSKTYLEQLNLKKKLIFLDNKFWRHIRPKLVIQIGWKDPSSYNWTCESTEMYKFVIGTSDLIFNHHQSIK